MDSGSFDEVIYCKVLSDHCSVVLTKEVNGYALFFSEEGQTYLLSFYSNRRRDEAIEAAVHTAQFQPDAIRSDVLACI